MKNKFILILLAFMEIGTGCSESYLERREVFCNIVTVEVAKHKDSIEKMDLEWKVVEQLRLLMKDDYKDVFFDEIEFAKKNHQTNCLGICIYSSAILCALEKCDVKTLKGILENYCPDYIGSWTFEYVLAQLDVDNSVGVLVDVYFSVNVSNGSRKSVLYCLRRAFPQLAKQYSEDVVFVLRCKEWLDENKGSYVLNLEYEYLVNSKPSFFNFSENATMQDSLDKQGRGLYIAK